MARVYTTECACRVCGAKIVATHSVAERLSRPPAQVVSWHYPDCGIQYARLPKPAPSPSKDGGENKQMRKKVHWHRGHAPNGLALFGCGIAKRGEYLCFDFDSSEDRARVTCRSCRAAMPSKDGGR